jgi:hypothetical protein
LKALLWDVNISEAEFKKIIHNQSHPEHKWALVRLFSLFPIDKLFDYITHADFLRIWPEIRDNVREDFWGRARVEKWDWFYRVITESMV